MKFSKSFSVKGDVDKVFDQVRAFISTSKFDLEHQDKPEVLVAKRGSRFPLFSAKIEDYETVLTITIKQVKDKVHVLCDYDVKPTAIFTSSDKSTLESEVNKLEFFLKTLPLCDCTHKQKQRK